MAVAVAVFSSLAVVAPAFAEGLDVKADVNVGVQGQGWGVGQMNKMGDEKGIGMMKPIVVGKVTAISGNTLTVSGRLGMGMNTSVTIFTVDATNAKILKDKATTTISSIVVGDTIAVQGTVTGSSVVATNIREVGERDGDKGDKKDDKRPLPPQILGNGQPVIAGSVTAVSGSTLTLTNKSNVQYTVNAASAKIFNWPVLQASLRILNSSHIKIVKGSYQGSFLLSNKKANGLSSRGK